MKFCATCFREVMPLQIMCAEHWARVPPELRAEIRKFKGNRESPEYVAAVRQACAFVRVELAVQRELDNYVAFHKG